MTFVSGYLIPRLIQYILVIFVGVTAVFVIPRFLPADPVQRTISEISSRGAYLDPKAIDGMIEDLTELYGLEGSMFDQYISFWKRLFRGDFGASFFQFPTPVMALIRTALPWTLGLLLTTTFLAWTVSIRPMPYYIFAFMLLLLLAYVFRLFPVAGGAAIGRQPAFTWDYISDVLRHAFLPALSLVLLGGAGWFQTMKLIVQNVKGEDFVRYARLGGIHETRIVSRYVIRNAMLPQITALALLLGQIFSGALITEIVFSYPGLGTLLYNAILTGDYNLIMGVTVFSIVAITTAILIIDLLYPLFDPRIRYS